MTPTNLRARAPSADTSNHRQHSFPCTHIRQPHCHQTPRRRSRPSSLLLQAQWGGQEPSQGEVGRGGRGGRGWGRSSSNTPQPDSSSTTRNPRWRGGWPSSPTPPPSGPSGGQAATDRSRQQQGQGQELGRPPFQLRGTAKRLFQNERLRGLVEQDVEEQHKGRWGTGPGGGAEEGGGGEELQRCSNNMTRCGVAKE